MSRTITADDVAWALWSAAGLTGQQGALRGDPRNALYYGRNCTLACDVAYRALQIVTGEALVHPVADWWVAPSHGPTLAPMVEDFARQVAGWLGRPGVVSVWTSCADHAVDAFVYSLAARSPAVERKLIDHGWWMPGQVRFIGTDPGRNA